MDDAEGDMRAGGVTLKMRLIMLVVLAQQYLNVVFNTKVASRFVQIAIS